MAITGFFHIRIEPLKENPLWSDRFILRYTNIVILKQSQHKSTEVHPFILVLGCVFSVCSSCAPPSGYGIVRNSRPDISHRYCACADENSMIFFLARDPKEK